MGRQKCPWEKRVVRQLLLIHSKYLKSTEKCHDIPRRVGEDKGDFFKPLLIESTVNNKNAF